MEAGRLRLPDASATRSIPARRQGGRGARPLSAPGGRTTAGNSFAAPRLSPWRAAAPFSSFSSSSPLHRARRGSPARPGEAAPCPLPAGMMASRLAAGPRFPGSQPEGFSTMRRLHLSRGNVSMAVLGRED